jgi:CBS domain containing-hemolysin-like protein
MIPILIVAGTTLVASFLCSLFEAALYAVRPSQLEAMRAIGVSGAERVAKMRANVEEPIAAILTINTVAHTIGASWCGAMVGEAYGSTWVGVFAAVFTVLVLALTEIIPKSVGVRWAGSIAPRIAWPLQAMVWLSWPIARPARAWMRRITGSETPVPSEDEVVHFARQAASGGAVRREERRWVENALKLDEVTAADLRTPRTVVETLPADLSIAEATDDPSKWTHSRVPVTEGNDPDQIVGKVLRREVFDARVSGQGNRTLRELARPMRFVPEATPAHELLEQFLEHRSHMVGVVDEYGGFEGIVTLEDVLEELLGAEIVDESDEHDDMQEHARQSAPGTPEPPERPEPPETPEPAAGPDQGS